MSKKIDTVIRDRIKPNLSLLFHEHLRNVDVCDDYYDEWDGYCGWNNYFDDDESDVVFPLASNYNKGKNRKEVDPYGLYWQGEREDSFVSKGKHKHRNRGKKKGKARIVDINDEESYPKKIIWFYLDYHDQDNRLEFNTLRDFEKYCHRKGYYVSISTENYLVYSNLCHCCVIDSDGVKEVVCEDTYSHLFYSVCDVSELSGC